MFASFIYIVFFIALLIDCPPNVTRDPVSNRLSLSNRLNKTRDPNNLRSVYTISSLYVRPALRLTST
jgi:hypothetical protein